MIAPYARFGEARITMPAFDFNAFVAKHGGVTGKKIASGQAIYSQGDGADCIFYIQKGQVQLTVVSMQGKEAVISVLEAGDFCGEGCLVGEELRLSTATAMTECVIGRLEKSAVVQAIHNDPSFSEFFLMYVLHRTIRMRDDLIDHLFNSSEKRLARVLLVLANFGKEGRSETVLNKINQQTLARIVGTTRSRINFFMNKFRKLGYIEYNGQIRVHSSLLTVVLHDQPNGLDGIEPPAA